MGRLAVVAVALSVIACANATKGDPSSDLPDAAPRGDGGGGGGGTRVCPAGEYATNVDGSGNVTCGSPDAAAHQAVKDSCSVYLGSRDDCNGCVDPPTKWGSARSASCDPGVGAANKCTTPSLDGGPVQMFGLNFDGDVDGNDKIYSTLQCAPVDAGAAAFIPCPEGQLVTGKYGSNWTCGSIASIAADYVRENCSIYTGWQDNCDACTTAPAKWGWSSSTGCMATGGDNTCSTATLGAATGLRLFGLNPDGDLDGNDKLHVGLACKAAADTTSTQTMACPAGQFVTETLVEGGFKCATIAPVVERYFADRCTLFFGWRDACEGCNDPPAKWGRVRVGACANGTGADNTCSKFTLGETSIEMFGLNPDGDVDGNDTLYVGLRCD